MSPRTRSLWVSVHRWSGIILGVLVVLIGVTGSLLIYEDELDTLLNPDLFRVQPGETYLPYDEIIAAAAAVSPDHLQPGYLSRLDDSPARPVVVTLQGDTSEEVQVFINPYTAEVLGTRSGLSSMALIRRLHGDLALGSIGEDIIGVLSIVMAFMCVMGLVVWWPSKGAWLRSFKVNFRARPRILLRDLHNAGGAYMFVFLFLSAVTVPPIVWKLTTPSAGPAQSTNAGPAQAGGSTQSESSQSGPAQGGPPQGAPAVLPPSISWQAAIDAAQDAVSGQWVGFTLKPLGPAPFYMVRLWPPGETETTEMTTVFVNRYSGNILRVSSPQALTPTRMISADFVITLHSGAVAGDVGRLLMFIAGLGFAVLFASGLATWWIRTFPSKRTLETSTEQAAEQ